MTELITSNNVSISNSNENRYVLDQQNHIHDNVISSNHTLPNLEICTEDLLNAINTMSKYL